jgi:hypothetical protein
MVLFSITHLNGGTGDISGNGYERPNNACFISKSLWKLRIWSGTNNTIGGPSDSHGKRIWSDIIELIEG